jgi:Zn-dependent protease
VLYFIIGYIALYLTIWLHEVGHSFMYKKYGCKENAFKVTVPFYLFFSTPAPVDINKLQFLTKNQDFNISITGMVINFFIGIPLYLIF